LRLKSEQVTFNLLKQNLSIQDIAERRRLAASTIYSHIEQLILAGENIAISRFVPAQKQQVIRKALKAVGMGPLTSVKEHLGDDYSFEEIRLVRAKLAIENSTKY